MRLRFLTLIPIAALAVAAHADDFSYATWNTTSSGDLTGTIQTDEGPVTATLTGDYTVLNKNFDVFSPTSSYVGGIVGNAPVQNDAIRVDRAGSFTLTFSRPITHLAYSIWSLGASNAPVSYAFSQPFDVVAGGPNSSYGGGGLVKTGNSVSGQEGNGTLLFTGTYASITWDVVGSESYHVFTIGASNVQATPEPASLAVLAGGALVALRRRKRA